MNAGHIASTASSASAFTGRLALVTGAGSGIGRAVTRALVERGARVVAWDKDERALSSLAEECGDAVLLDPVDVTDAARVAAGVERAESVAPVEYLVNAAGILGSGELAALEAEDFQRTFRVNVEGVWNVTKEATRAMRARRRGAAVTVSSNAGATPRLGMGAYGASKAAATMLTRSFALELAPYGIRCNVVSPGSTDTPMLRAMLGDAEPARLVAGAPEKFRLGIPLGRVAEAADIAEAVVFLLSPAARHITLHDLRVDGGATF